MDSEEIHRKLTALPPREQRRLAKQLLKQAARQERMQWSKTTARRNALPFFKGPALAWTIASLLLFLIVEGLVFRLGWYNKYLEPNSTAGQVEGYMSWLKRFPHARLPEILVMGDSRIAEGFSAREAAAVAGNRIRFWNFGIGGTTPRAWYYMLRDADPTRRRFAAIVIPFDEYADEDRVDSGQDRYDDLNYLIGRLRLTDCADFASSMSPQYQATTLTGCLLRGITLRHDAQDFLQHISDRIKRTKDFRNNGLSYIDDYSGRPEDLRGLTADFVHRALHFPPGVTGSRRTTVEVMIMSPPAPQNGNLTRYRKRWFGGILDLYKNSPTRIVFLELPRGPISRPESLRPWTFLQSVIGRPDVTALPSNTFRDLERPEVYFDGLHLNKIGRRIFSERLAERILPLVGIH